MRSKNFARETPSNRIAFSLLPSASSIARLKCASSARSTTAASGSNVPGRRGRGLTLPDPWGQVAHAHERPIDEDVQGFHEVPQLADVARPRVVREAGEGLLLERLARAALLQEVPGKHGRVVGALPQRRDVDADAVDAVKQILAEAAVRDGGLRAPVARADDTHIRADRLVAAKALEGALLEDAQQLGLHVERRVEDLV